MGEVTFVPDESDATVRTVNYEVADDVRRQGIARALAQELVKCFPGYELVEGPDSNSPPGQGLLDRLRAEGFPYHEAPCFLGVDGCMCGLKGRTRSARA